MASRTPRNGVLRGMLDVALQRTALARTAQSIFITGADPASVTQRRRAVVAHAEQQGWAVVDAAELAGTRSDMNVFAEALSEAGLAWSVPGEGDTRLSALLRSAAESLEGSGVGVVVVANLPEQLPEGVLPELIEGIHRVTQEALPALMVVAGGAASVRAVYTAKPYADRMFTKFIVE